MTLRIFRVSLFFAVVVGFQGCDGRIVTSSKASLPPKDAKSLVAPTLTAQEGSASHRYENAVNRLVERRLAVTDRLGKPAERGQLGPNPQPIRNVELKIVWTSPNDYGWNYLVPEIHHGKDLFNTEFPSEPIFLEKTTRGKVFLRVGVPETPYDFEIIDGRVSPFFMDHEKDVIWHVSGMDQEFRGIGSISLSPKKITFLAGGGDYVERLVCDFSNREDAPRIAYDVEGGLP